MPVALTKIPAKEELKAFIRTERDGRQVKKALAVKLMYQDYRYEDIIAILDVSMGVLSKWKQAYERARLAGFRPQHKGRQSYLTAEAKDEVLQWLQTKKIWELSELESHLAERYEIVSESKQSDYDLFEAAGISWKKTSKVNPKADAQAVVAKKTTSNGGWHAIEAGRSRVLFQDESHLLSGDRQGYVWDRTDERIEIPIVNERERQTYYGALDLMSKRLVIEAHPKGIPPKPSLISSFYKLNFPANAC